MLYVTDELWLKNYWISKVMLEFGDERNTKPVNQNYVKSSLEEQSEGRQGTHLTSLTQCYDSILEPLKDHHSFYPFPLPNWTDIVWNSLWSWLRNWFWTTYHLHFLLSLDADTLVQNINVWKVPLWTTLFHLKSNCKNNCTQIFWQTNSTECSIFCIKITFLNHFPKQI